MSEIIKTLQHEFKSTIPAIVFFAFAFNLIHFSQGLMLPPGSIRYTSTLGATLGAIIAGKVIIIANTLPFINRFPDKPLIYNILWKFFIYSLFIIPVQLLDEICKHLYLGDNLTVTYNYVKQMLGFPGFWGTQMMVLFLFLIFVVFSEFSRVIGGEKVKRILFG